MQPQACADGYIGTIQGEELAFGLDSNAQGSFIDPALVDMFPQLLPPVKPLPVPLSATTGALGTPRLLHN